MIKAGHVGIGLVLSAWAWMRPAEVSAQAATAPAPAQNSTIPPVAVMANPYLNPYMNPYMNPAATQQPMNGGNALLYLYAANAANGGVGSGRMSGTRGAPAVRPRPAEMPSTASTPGGGAARYFNPGPVNTGGAGRYYGQRNRYFQNNGR